MDAVVRPDPPHTAAGRFIQSALLDHPWETERLRAEESPEIIVSSEVIIAILRRLVLRRFRPDGDIREISRYVAQAVARETLDLRPEQARVAEAVIRSLLGEPWIAHGIPSEEAGTVAGCLLVDLVEQLSLTENDITDMIVAAEHDPVRDWRPAGPATGSSP
jgi:hypothetical protein